MTSRLRTSFPDRELNICLAISVMKKLNIWNEEEIKGDECRDPSFLSHDGNVYEDDMQWTYSLYSFPFF